MLKRIIYLLFLITITPAFAQVTLKGKITLAAGEEVSGASILLKENSKIISYKISDEHGKYEILIADKGKYLIEVNFLGYEKQIMELELKEGDSTIIKNFTLTESAKILEEVIIEYEQPVTLHGDTLVYDAKMLETGREVVVEDLLKNIPGVTIDDDGTIMYANQPVEKVMVDGDDLFNKGYSLLTKSMPVKPLDKIEILQNYSNNKLLKGIEDSKKVALNLTVEEEYKNLWFGDVLAGYGNDNRYLFSGNLMNFGEKYKAYFTTSLNNAGYDKVGTVDQMIYSSNEVESTGLGYKASQVMSLSFKSSRLSEGRTRFNNAEMATLSNIITLSPKLKLKLMGVVSFDELKAYQNSFSVTDFGSTYFENTEQNNSVSEFNRGYVSAFLNYDISKTKMLQINSAYSQGSNDFKNDLVFNGVSTQERLETKNTFADQKLTYTHKWKDKNVVLFKGRFFTDKLPQDYAINDYLMGDLFPYDNINAISNTVNSNKEYIGLETDFLFRKKNNDLIQFTIGFNHNDDDLTANFRLFTDTGNIEPQDFQAKSGYKVGNLYAKGGYKFDFEKFTIGADIAIHQLFNRFENNLGEVKSQNPFFINPVITASWQISGNSMISAHYLYSTTNSGLLQVNDSYLLKNSRSFSKGLGNFNQLESYVAGISFGTKHYLNRHGVTVGFDYSKQNDVISYRSQLDQNSSLSEAFVMQGGDRIGGRISAYKIVKPLEGTISLNAGVNRLVYYNVVNNSGLRKNILYSQNYKLNWKSNLDSYFNFDFGTEWTFSKVKSDYTFSSSYALSYLDLIFQVSDNLNIRAKSEYYYFGGEGVNNNYFFADAEARYSFAKDKYTIGLDARNLFNTQNFTTYSVSDIGHSTNSYRLLPRYIMATFKFRF